MLLTISLSVKLQIAKSQPNHKLANIVGEFTIGLSEFSTCVTQLSNQQCHQPAVGRAAAHYQFVTTSPLAATSDGTGPALPHGATRPVSALRRPPH